MTTDNQLTEKKINEIYSDAEVKISVSRYQLMDQTPFFGIVASNLKVKPIPKAQLKANDTLFVTRTGLCFYNPFLIAQSPLPEVKGFLTHEALHPALNYFERFIDKDCDPDLSNEAHDYAINLMIKDNQEVMDLPDWVLYDENYRGLSAEEIYQQLKVSQQAGGNGQQGDGNGKQAGGNGQQGDGQFSMRGDANDQRGEELEKQYYQEVHGKPLTEDEFKAIQKDNQESWKTVLQQAIVEHHNKGQGTLPAWLETEVEGILHPKLDYQKMIKRFFGRFGRNDRPSYKHRNKRNTYQPNTFLKPKMIQSSPKVYLLLDTSGSMFYSEETLGLIRNALGLVDRFAKNGLFEIEIYMCDVEVKKRVKVEELLESLRKKSLNILGGGGSNFTSAFEEIWQNALKEGNGGTPIFCFTDGMITVPEKNKGLRSDTMWLTPKNIEPPTKTWGHHVELQC